MVENLTCFNNKGAKSLAEKTWRLMDFMSGRGANRIVLSLFFPSRYFCLERCSRLEPADVGQILTVRQVGVLGEHTE